MTKKHEPREITNLTLADVTRRDPHLTYARCIDASNRPAKHEGDWPEEGKVYPVYLVDSKMEGIPLLHILGFEGKAPYYNAFSHTRFELIGWACLN